MHERRASFRNCHMYIGSILKREYFSIYGQCRLFDGAGQQYEPLLCLIYSFVVLLCAEPDLLRGGVRNHSFLDQAAHIELRGTELASPTLAGAAELALQPLLDDPRLARAR